jgi:hypothetical protein
MRRPALQLPAQVVDRERVREDFAAGSPAGACPASAHVRREEAPGETDVFEFNAKMDAGRQDRHGLMRHTIGLLRDTPQCLAEQKRAGLLGFDCHLLV